MNAQILARFIFFPFPFHVFRHCYSALALNCFYIATLHQHCVYFLALQCLTLIQFRPRHLHIAFICCKLCLSPPIQPQNNCFTFLHHIFCTATFANLLFSDVLTFQSHPIPFNTKLKLSKDNFYPKLKMSFSV